MKRALLLAVAALALAMTAALLVVACGSPDAASPFRPDAGSGGAAGQGGGNPYEAGTGGDESLGGPCSVDAQCDDGVACTFDGSDQELGRCRFTPDDSTCQNGLYCDGLERCAFKLGCISGEPVSCSDGNPCNINTCQEESKSCTSELRDVDADGDPDIHCGGGDCDDFDPAVSSLSPEVCANNIDDNCDMQVDEAGCVSPSNDNCFDPLVLTQAGTYPLSTAAAALDFAASCTVANPSLARDVVAAVSLPAGPPVDVQLTARADKVNLALALMGQCGMAASEIACSGGFVHPGGGWVAKVRARSVGDAQKMTVLPAYVFTENSTELTLRYELLAATTKPSNETCATAEMLSPDTPTVASIVDAKADLGSACMPASGDLVYRFQLAVPSDVNIYASSIDGDGLALISLRNEACALPGDEITCNQAPSGKASAHVFRHSLPAGSYHVAVAASAPTEVLLSLSVSPPTAAPADELCQGAPTLAHNKTIDVALAGHQDDISSSCLVGGVDAAYSLDLAEASDVLLIGRYSKGDAAAVALMLPSCSGPNDEVVCSTAQLSPTRAQARNVPAGNYRVITESQQSLPLQLTALTRPALPPTIVPFADGCNDVLSVPAQGGFFQGTTANAQADFNAGCDQGGQPLGGAPDQLLELQLSATKRVVLDMQGSAYATILDVREGPQCPGNEMLYSCAAGYYPERSFLDLELAAATYFIQIDGYAGQSGPWFLDIHVVDP